MSDEVEAEKVRTGLLVALRQARIVKWLRKPNSDGSPCSADHEVLAQRIERGEHLK
jgi:hypothetical protein